LTHADEYSTDAASHSGLFRSLYDPYLSRGWLLALDVIFISRNDLIADNDALIADVDVRPGNQLLDVVLILAAEGAAENLAAYIAQGHDDSLPINRL
jgi:hypothetical protein